MGDRGTEKSTTVRAFASLLPPIKAVLGCPYHCDPAQPQTACEQCRNAAKLTPETILVPVVDFPLGATEDRVAGALELERALSRSEKVFEPGLLAKAKPGYLYIDEVNLLEDHLVDLLLDVAASGENLFEREGLSVRHPARFELIGTAIRRRASCARNCSIGLVCPWRSKHHRMHTDESRLYGGASKLVSQYENNQPQ